MLSKIIAVAAAATLSFAGAANAITITAVDASGANVSPFPLGYFGNAGVNAFISNTPIAIVGGSITFGTGAAPQAGLYDGDVAGAASTAYYSTNLPRGNYLVAESSGSVEISFVNPQTQFQLLWSTIDSYNTLVFTLTNNQTIAVTGNDILAADKGAFSAFVSITDLSFKSVQVTSSTAAFEFVPNVVVPEPASIALLAAGAGLVGFIRGRRRTA